MTKRTEAYLLHADLGYDGIDPAMVLTDKALAEAAATKTGLAILAIPLLDRLPEVRVEYEVCYNIYAEGVVDRRISTYYVHEFSEKWAHPQPPVDLRFNGNAMKYIGIPWRIIIEGSDLAAIDAKAEELIAAGKPAKAYDWRDQ